MTNRIKGPTTQCNSNHLCSTGVVNTRSIAIWLKMYNPILSRSTSMMAGRIPSGIVTLLRIINRSIQIA